MSITIMSSVQSAPPKRLFETFVVGVGVVVPDPPGGGFPPPDGGGGVPPPPGGGGGGVPVLFVVVELFPGVIGVSSA